MNTSRLTEERLRCYLDSNQVMRERLCLAILPLLGPYTRERPRRPKGGPDQGRDIEAVYQGSTVVWGAVGFRNGGGNDAAARREAGEKFISDLERAIAENAALQGFVFFTNVDLTPGIIENLKEVATNRGLSVVDIFDMERLLHVLDSPEGLIPRLQYLEIPMSATEQIGLVSKFGNQLQNAVLARFDRVERTLSQMEEFLAFQKPLYRLDIFVSLNGNLSTSDIGEEALLVKIDGLQDLNKSTYFVCLNHTAHQFADRKLVTWPHLWLGENTSAVRTCSPSVEIAPSLMTAYCQLSLTTGGHRVRIADLTTISITAHFTERLYGLVNRLLIDANGFELFDCPISVNTERESLELPAAVPFNAESRSWICGVQHVTRDTLFEPPQRSRRYFPLYHT